MRFSLEPFSLCYQVEQGVNLQNESLLTAPECSCYLHCYIRSLNNSLHLNHAVSDRSVGNVNSIKVKAIPLNLPLEIKKS